MRYRVSDYIIDGQSIQLPKTTTLEDIRLIFNETQGVVLCSSGQKNSCKIKKDDVYITVENAVSVDGNTILINEEACILYPDDQLTIEVDYGDSIQDAVSLYDEMIAEQLKSIIGNV